MEVILARNCRQGDMLLASSTTVSVKAKMGRILHDTHCKRRSQRNPVIERSLPEVRAHAVGRSFYCPRFRQALFNDKYVFADHSLVASLHPGRAVEIGEAQAALITDDKQPHPAARRIDGDVHVACNEGSGTWGHWLIHNLPRALLFLDAYPDGRLLLPRGYRGGRYAACGEILSLFGVEPAQLEFVDPSEMVEVENAVVVDVPYGGGLPHPLVLERFGDIRPADVSRIEGGPETASKIFVERSVGTREVANREEVGTTLTGLGYTNARLGEQPLSGQITAWQAASCVAGILGSDLTNMVFSQDVRVHVITPEWFGDNFFFGIAAMKGIEWHELYCGEMVEERTPAHKSSFRIDPQELANLLAGEGDE